VFVSFGEIMMRLSPPGHRRLLDTSAFDMTFGGGEANVAVSLAQLGIPSRFVTALPDNDIAQACINSLRSWGVDTSCIVRWGHRVGIYYLERGAAQRPSQVIYDRKGSSISEIDPLAYNWDVVFDRAKWFHFTGITPALSSSAAVAIGEAAEAAKRLKMTVSCDLNYRSKLWTKDHARAIMTDLMPLVDVLFANEEDAESVFGIKAGKSEVTSGHLDHAWYVDVAQQLSDRFALAAVGITLRESISASRNGWSGLLFTAGKPFFSSRYEIDIVDRIGAGDAFAAGAIYGLLNSMAPQATVDIAAAASCLKHSVPGDFNIASLAEIDALVRGGGSGRVVR
jgi:2-dehydro-3-deoxygluconokinase